MMKNIVIANRLSAEATEYLERKNIRVLTFPENINVDKRVAYHADLSFFFDGMDTLFIAKEFSAFEDELKQYVSNVVVLNKKLSEKYPGDVLLNCVCVGKNLICNTDTVYQEIVGKMKTSGYNIINVKQGYTKCSVVPVSESALITDDESIFSECRNHGLDVLKVQKGSVYLEGFDYGFIGGTCGLVDNELIFNGDITSHPDFDSIDLFLKKYGIIPVSFENKLTDIGSIISIGGM